MTYANIPRAPHLCLSNLGADWQKTRIIRTHVNLICVQQALANQIGNVPLFANENYPISSLRPLLRSQSPVYNIPVTALNDFFSRYLEYNVKFIKIDTEGAELLVLLGLSNVISWFRPIIMYEESESSFNAFNYKAMDIITFLVYTNTLFSE